MAKLDEFTTATRRASERRATEASATAARYDRRRGRIIVNLSNGLELAFPPAIAQGLEKAKAQDLADIEISPSGFGIHFPKLDAHLYLPALLRGVFGSKSWMASQLGAAGGSARSVARQQPRAPTASGVAGRARLQPNRDSSPCDRIEPAQSWETARSPSVEHSVSPCSMASAARCASGTRLPCTPERLAISPALRHDARLATASIRHRTRANA